MKKIENQKKEQVKNQKALGRRLYTDENPRDTVSIKFATPADARATVAKVKRVNKTICEKNTNSHSWRTKSQSYG